MDEAPNNHAGEETLLIERYWGGRALWFIWRHRKHGTELEWQTDNGDFYYEAMQKEYTEVEEHRECQVAAK